jgi:hypothetical protein
MEFSSQRKANLYEEDKRIEKEALSNARKDLAAAFLIGLAFVLILIAISTVGRS